MSTTERSLVIEQPGLFTTVQDLGRPGLARFGVTRGGAIDRTALVLGNRLVGNEPDAAGLECTLAGPVIRFTADAIIAITGADFAPALDGRACPMWQPVSVNAGSLLAFAPAPVAAGSRAYVTVAGGIVTEPVLGSRSTDLVGQFGGVDGRELAAGDSIPLGNPSLASEEILRRRLADDPPLYERQHQIRIVPGPQWDRFTAAGQQIFLDATYTVTSRSDRTGIRLSGPAIEQTHGADLISEGIAYGAIQVPADGQPIILLAARQTVGGYVKIATVIGADLDRLGQARSGDEIRFVEVSVDDARDASKRALKAQDASAIVERDLNEDESMNQSNGWTPDGVIRVIAEAERAGVIHLKLTVESAGIALEINRGGSASLAISPDAGATDASTDDSFVAITAPVLGTFYRRPDPDAEPFVSVGDSVTDGDQIGLIEVMKSYHEVIATASGTIREILADDGHYVEFGQVLLTIDPV